jgi:histidinol dehydrogenase
MRVLEGKATVRAVDKLARRGAADLSRVEPAVRRIVNAVRRDGDRALRRYAQRWDGVERGQSLQVSPEEISAALERVTPKFRNALREAAANIRRYCEWQKPREWTRASQPGLCVGQIVRPLASVGCYVPGGRYPLPSTVLMTVIPAQVAGVKEITVVSPRPATETLAAAALLGIKRVFRVGGAQAIAALAYSTESVTRVEKIVGPGNLFVTAAKKMVAWDCAIDFLAGPTEVVLVSFDGNPSLLASDLAAQAEHDPDACSILVTTSRRIAQQVVAELKPIAVGNAVARESLRRNGMVLVAASREQAFQFANRIAAEHVTVPTMEDAALVVNAGAVFVGDYSPQAMGDYASGPNHVLPTGAVARWRGGLTVLDFVKIISVQQGTATGLRKLEPTITTLAEAEGLMAHAESVRVRCRNA